MVYNSSIITPNNLWYNKVDIGRKLEQNQMFANLFLVSANWRTYMIHILVLLNKHGPKIFFKRRSLSANVVPS